MMSGREYLESKIGRAYKHLKEFDALVVDYCRRPDVYAITKEDDVVNRRYVVRCEPDLIEGDIAHSLGDAVFNLRSGLDQLAWGLALLGNPDPGKDTMFPIHSDQLPRSEDIFKRRVWDMPCEAIAVIKELQPYHRGNAYRDDPLWQLNELSNIDKHRLPAGRATVANIYVEPLGYTMRTLGYCVEFSWPLAVKDSVVVKPQVPTLVFGDPIDSTSSRTAIELTREQIAEIYRYVREDVSPRFTRFFP